MSKKRKMGGFTLVELLVTIALMLSLLGIAIVSFIKISDNRKKEAYELVKDQIFTAAEQYMESNAYKHEAYQEGSTATISLGFLVAEDYLNTVTNPIDGKKLNKCSTVKLIKRNNRMVATEFDKNSTTCNDSGNYFTLSTPKAPEVDNPQFVKFSTKSEAKKAKDDWFNKESLAKNDEAGVDTLSVKITGESEDKINPIIITKCDGIGCNSYGEKVGEGRPDSNGEFVIYDDNTYNQNTVIKTTRYKISQLNEFTEAHVIAGVDTEPPTVDLSVVNNTDKTFNIIEGTDYQNDDWINGDVAKGQVIVKATFSDQTSKLDNASRYLNGGNQKSYVKSDATSGTDLSEYVKDKKLVEGVIQSGVSGFVDDGYRVGKYYAEDAAGNHNEKYFYVKIDRTSPTCETASVTPTNKGKKPHDGWYNFETGAPVIQLKAQDSLSGIGGKTTVQSKAPTQTVEEAKNKTYSNTFTDGAGNTQTCSTKVSYDAKAPDFELVSSTNLRIRPLDNKRAKFARCIRVKKDLSLTYNKNQTPDDCSKNDYAGGYKMRYKHKFECIGDECPIDEEGCPESYGSYSGWSNDGKYIGFFCNYNAKLKVKIEDGAGNEKEKEFSVPNPN